MQSLTLFWLRHNYAPRLKRRRYGIGEHSGFPRSLFRIRMAAQRPPCSTRYGILVPIRKVARKDKRNHVRWMRWWLVQLVGSEITGW